MSQKGVGQCPQSLNPRRRYQRGLKHLAVEDRNGGIRGPVAIAADYLESVIVRA
jgi:hypothetical protein